MTDCFNRFENFRTLELDVLEIDIMGKGTHARFRRWWHNKLLLSNKDLRCKQYYLSSFSVYKERLTHFRNYRFIIHPFSSFRYFWDCFILVVYLIKKTLFHYNSSIVVVQMPLVAYICGVLAEVFTFVDIFINMITGYIQRNTKTIILEPRKVVLKYLSTQLFIDAMGAFPTHALLFLRYGSMIDCSLCKSNTFNCVLTFTTLFNLIKVIQVTNILDTERMSYKMMAFCRLTRIVLLYFVVMMTVLNISDSISLMLLIFIKQISEDSFYMSLIRGKYVYGVEGVFFEVVRVLKTLLLFGYSLEPQENKSICDKIKPLIGLILANVFYIWCLIESYSWLSRMYYSDDKRVILRDRAINMLRSRQLPDHLCQKVKNYFMYSGTLNFVIERNNSLYSSLPETLKGEISVHKYQRLIRRVPLFAPWPNEVLHEIVYVLQEDIYMKGDVVSILPIEIQFQSRVNHYGESKFHFTNFTKTIVQINTGGLPWSQGDGLVILEAGELSVFNINNEETAHLIDGDYFGELSLVTDNGMRMSTVVAVSNSKVLLLDTDLFRRIMRKYPGLFFELKNNIKKKFRKVATGENRLLGLAKDT